MSANCEWVLTLNGRNRNKYLKEILETLYRIENVDSDRGAKIFKVNDGKNFFTLKVETRIFADNGQATKIWGDNYLELDADVFCAIAKAVPGASWVAKVVCVSENGGDGCESYVEACYEKGILVFKTDNYVDSVTLTSLIERMGTDDDSFEAFTANYKVDDSIDEETYEDYKYDDCEDDFFFNHSRNTVSRHHIWDIKTYTIK